MIKNKTFKKFTPLLSFLLIATLFSPSTVFAESDDSNEIKNLAEEYQVAPEEIEDLQTNLDTAVDQLPDLEVGETIEVPVSENLILEAEIVDDGITPTRQLLRSTYMRTLTATLTLKNVFGVVIVSLDSIGVFITDGKYSTAIDAFGSYAVPIWQISIKSSKGAKGYNTFARNTFAGKYKLGIDPITVTLQTFSYTNSIYCNAKGGYSSRWS